MTVTGSKSCELRMPMLAEARPETPICRKPSIAEALPMLWSKGTRARAAALGKARPRLRHPDVNRLNGGFGGTKLRPNRVGFSAGCPPVIGVKSDPCRKFNFRFSRPAVW